MMNLPHASVKAYNKVFYILSRCQRLGPPMYHLLSTCKMSYADRWQRVITSILKMDLWRHQIKGSTGDPSP